MTTTTPLSIPSILSNNDLTTLETQVILELSTQLNDWIGSETYSPVECADVANGTGLTVRSVKGIIGSLTKKGIVSTYEHEECRGWDGKIEEKAFQVIYFVDQDLMQPND